jgi:hypothetical protein
MNQLIREATKILRRQSVYCFVLALILMTWTFWPSSGQAFTTGNSAPDISGGPWLNSRPLTIEDLKGRVVVLEFWTYG